MGEPNGTKPATQVTSELNVILLTPTGFKDFNIIIYYLMTTCTV